jgi:selT/selW/selH-like putative selenoprotein
MATRILYCSAWGYRPRAVSLAAILKSRFDENVELTPGKSGQFDVITDDKLIFSKGAAGRFPLDGEVEQALAKVRKG